MHDTRGQFEVFDGRHNTRQYYGIEISQVNKLTSPIETIVVVAINGICIIVNGINLSSIIIELYLQDAGLCPFLPGLEDGLPVG